MRNLTLSILIGALVVLVHQPAFGQSCPTVGDVILNEIRYTPASEAFIELRGEPGLPLDCLKLVSFNGGAEGTKCDPSTVLEFDSAHFIGADGYFVLSVEELDGTDVVTSKANLQDGPDGLQIQVVQTGQVLDSLAYGGPLEACETPVMEGADPAPSHSSTTSIGRRTGSTDTNQNGIDWGLCTSPTPGEENLCPQPAQCNGLEEETIPSFSEFQFAAPGDDFVELKGAPGTPLDCFMLRTWNGTAENDDCLLEEELTLIGVTTNPVGVASVYMNLQKGPDAIELVYLKTDGTEEIVDLLVWGAPMPQCGGEIGAADAVDAPPNGMSISRCFAFGDVSKDFVITEPTPGELNDCPAPCAGPTGTVVINEAVIDPNDVAFFELKGDPGLDLSCYRLLELNGGQSLDICEEEKNFSLTGYVIPDDGYFVGGTANVAAVDMEVQLAAQNGPGDGFRLIYGGDSGDIVVDSFSWGATLAACTDPPSKDSGYGPIVKEGNSIARCPDGRDTNSNNVDLFEAEGATPGQSNACPDLEALAVCDELPTAPVVINEILTSPGTSAFIELKGTPNTAMGCYKLLAYNGGPDADRCEIYETIDFQGTVIGETGFFTITPAGGDWAWMADLESKGADLQDGPDALALIFTSTAGQVVLMDALVYGGELPQCDDFNEGDPAEKTSKERSLTRCAGEDTNSNARDFTLCSVPSPGEQTTCNCGAPNPSGGTVSVEEPEGCHAGGGTFPWILLLAGLFLLFPMALRQSR